MSGSKEKEKRLQEKQQQEPEPLAEFNIKIYPGKNIDINFTDQFYNFVFYRQVMCKTEEFMLQMLEKRAKKSSRIIIPKTKLPM